MDNIFNYRAPAAALDTLNGIGQAVMDTGGLLSSGFGLVPNDVSRFFDNRKQLLKDSEIYPEEDIAAKAKIASEVIAASGAAAPLYNLGKTILRGGKMPLTLSKEAAWKRPALMGLGVVEAATLAADSKEFIEDIKSKEK